MEARELRNFRCWLINRPHLTDKHGVKILVPLTEIETKFGDQASSLIDHRDNTGLVQRQNDGTVLVLGLAISWWKDLYGWSR